MGTDRMALPNRADVTRVAEQLDLLARANAALAHELLAITGSRRCLSQATVTRLELLVERMRPAAAARESLAGVEEDLLLAGAREWQRRQSSGGPRR